MFNYLDQKYYSRIIMHSSTQNNYVSLAKEFQKRLSKEHCKHGVVDKGRFKKGTLK